MMGSSATKEVSSPQKVAELNNQYILSQYDKQEDTKELGMTP
jgi:ADP-ribosyl-[dinitrogen reductase] hydrolase